MSGKIKLFCGIIVFLCVVVNAGMEQSRKIITINPKTPEGLQKLFKYTGKSLRLVSAHRGGVRKGFPENCIATFENTLRHTAAIMEIDPRYTKDGAIVLHHDRTLERTTNGKGVVSEFTLGELKKLKLKDAYGNLTEHSMPTLDEALEWSRGKTILVLDDKGVSMKERVRKIEMHNAEAYAMVMAYNYKDAKLCYKLNKRIMMEVFIKNRKEFEVFDKTGVPWSNVVVFVGHSVPEDSELCGMIHAKGALCMASTSRDIERKFINKEITSLKSLKKDYRALSGQGVDIIETDIPIEAGACWTNLFR